MLFGALHIIWGDTLYSTTYIEDPKVFDANVDGQTYQLTFTRKYFIDLDEK